MYGFSRPPSAPSQPRTYSEQIVEPGQGLQEDVGPLVGELVAAGDEEVQRLVQVEVQVPKEAIRQGEAETLPL